MENLININLEYSTAPQIQEARGKNWIEYGTDDYKNLYPQFIIDLYYNSGTHSAIINATAQMIAGQDVTAKETDSVELNAKLENFFKNANSKETLHEVIKKCAFDFKLQGGFALNVIYSKSGQVAEIYHVPVERLRVGLPNELGRVDKYYICADWSNIRRNKPQEVAAFNPLDRSTPSQILYTGLYSPNMEMYYTPDYSSACNWALIDQKVSEYHLGNIERGFSGSYFINMNNGVPTAEERLQIERSIEKKFTGSGNSGKFVLSFSDSKDRAAEITPIEVSNADKQYLALQELLVQNIMTGHRVTSPMLLGVKTEGQLGGRDELMQAFEIYQNTVVKPYQEHILKTLKKILLVNDIQADLQIVQSSPIMTTFTVEDMRNVMTKEEIREKLGLEPLEQENLESEKLAKVGDIDGMPVYSTVEEALIKAKELGCEGFHEHELNGEKVYMPCAKHEDTKTRMNLEKTELDLFLETVEDIPEDWQLVEEEVVDGEHVEFDFEGELNKIATEKVELSTGRAIPDAESDQDGISKKTFDYFRVRYVYAEDEFLKRKTGKKRDFCQKMLAAKKLYRKEDIDRMFKLNKEFSPKGTGQAGYDKFIWKGGSYCHHFWLRQIYKTKLGIDVSTKIKDAELIGYTKARSEGFTAKKNDKRVAIAPKRMPRQGRKS
tara:strand:+ start:1684 stop:3675 length:1992 start_codon:yes stop_codon:yes gene_type:complete